MWRYRWFHWYQVCLINCTWIRCCIIKTSLGLPQKSLAIFGNSRKMFENVLLAFGTILENLQKSAESGRKSSENHQKRRHQYIYIIKRKFMLAWRYELYVLVARTKSQQYLVARILFLPLEHKINIFSPPCNILYHCYGSRAAITQSSS